MERGQQQGIIPLRLKQKRVVFTASQDELAELLLAEQQKSLLARQ